MDRGESVLHFEAPREHHFDPGGCLAACYTMYRCSRKVLKGRAQPLYHMYLESFRRFHQRSSGLPDSY